MKYITIAFIVLLAACAEKKQPPLTTALYEEANRPQVHFSPAKGWMNDPNGLVYFNNTWHLFFQHYPDSTVWGPMHWGHATSSDLVHWQEQPIALYPDTLGYIFSGSIVADMLNTSGFGKDGKQPLVAIFTQHDPKGEKQGRNDFQQQSIAYSLDEGKTWTKYASNPVLKNPGTKDFRDPKVSWNSVAKKWIMTLAVKDRVHFYSSTDLKQWTKESEFGEANGSHGGVWECPDLFSLQDGNKTVWVLFVSINPGGPAGGSATQYFIGDFDGKTFHTTQTEPRWLDQGTDNYAGVTFSNTGSRRIYIGWMSNWQYAQTVPTSTWRSAMTIPRQLSLGNLNGEYYLRSLPAYELSTDMSVPVLIKSDSVGDIKMTGPTALGIKTNQLQDLSITLQNEQGEKWIAGYDSKTNEYYIDRTNAGKKEITKEFARRIATKRIGNATQLNMALLIDASSVELFADKGLNALTSIFFPSAPYNRIQLQSNQKIDTVTVSQIHSIWKN